MKGCLTPVRLFDEESCTTRYVPCGKCVKCLEKNQRDWVCRMYAESKVHPRPLFITLTYAEEYIPADRQVSKKELQRFLHTLRVGLNRLADKYGEERIKLGYYACGEYGREQGQRPHYHLMMFGWPLFMSKRQVHDECKKAWYKGFVKVEDFVPRTVNYVAKYMAKLDPRPHKVPPFRLVSRAPAIGRTFFDNKKWRTYFNQPNVKLCVNFDGRWYALPRYYEFLFTDEKLQSLRLSRSEYANARRMWMYEHEGEWQFDLLQRKNEQQRLLLKIQLRFH